MAAFVDRTGLQYGRLVADCRGPNAAGGKARWWCLCDCDGKRVLVRGSHLQSGGTQSCGCLQRERSAAAAARNTAHGMRQRCGYSGRGISVYWSIDRIDNDGVRGVVRVVAGNYEPQP